MLLYSSSQSCDQLISAVPAAFAQGGNYQSGGSSGGGQGGGGARGVGGGGAADTKSAVKAGHEKSCPTSICPQHASATACICPQHLHFVTADASRLSCLKSQRNSQM